ncbi:MAG: methyltransferase domain-containing protein [Calditrichaeota bacterium]|nr:methyltransferase domain-containing protein [Calditrichota bacterium]
MLKSIKRAGFGGAMRMQLEYRFGATNEVDHVTEKIQALAPYVVERELGRGKDGITLLLRSPEGGRRVHKLLSRYGLSYYPRTRELAARLAILPEFVALELGSEGFSYEWEELKPLSGYTKDFLGTFAQVCAMESGLLGIGQLYWDLGSEHSNYLLRDDGRIRVIDYGGNAFIPAKGRGIRSESPSWRPYLQKLDPGFMRAQLLLHICEFSLGETHSRILRSATQFSRHGIEQAIAWSVHRLEGTPFQVLCEDIAMLKPDEANSWRTLERSIRTLESKIADDGLQEAADIDSVQLTPGAACVRGYQSYDIRDGKLHFHSQGNLWDTKEKGRIVTETLSRLTAEADLRSMLDLGSNLGAYVFLAALEYALDPCIGVDYNDTYVRECERIAAHLKLANCHFRHGRFSQDNDPVDLTLALGLVHHLYQRTESFGSLDEIVAHLARTSRKWLLVEFPDEHDNKASKWTRMPGRARTSPYTRAAFEDALSGEFGQWEVTGRIGDTRHFYLCTKA